MPFRRDTVNREVPEECFGEIIRVFPARTNLDSKVTMLLPCLMRDDFHSVQLKDGACDSLPCLCIVESGHPFLDSNGSSSGGQRVCFAF